MELIASYVEDGVVKPVKSIPPEAVAVAFDGENYVVYVDGDEIPTPESGE